MFERLETLRLILRKPEITDAESIFKRYSSDPEVTRLVGWLRHTSVDATRAFLEFSNAEWAKWPVGPYVIESRENGQLLGGTGLSFESNDCTMTGYVLARDEWGKGYATEALTAMVELAGKLGVIRLYAVCHPENTASWRVLEKSGFTRESIRSSYLNFPNLNQHDLSDVVFYALVPGR